MQSMGQLPIHTRPADTGKLNKPLSMWRFLHSKTNRLAAPAFSSAAQSALQKENHLQHHMAKTNYRKMKKRPRL